MYFLMKNLFLLKISVGLIFEQSFLHLTAIIRSLISNRLYMLYYSEIYEQ